MFYTVDEEKTLILVVGIMLVVYLLLIGFGIATYIMNAIAYQKIASRRLIANPWLAWIPIASSWLIGSIVDEYDGKNGLKRKWRVVLLTLSIISVGGIVAGYVGLVAWAIKMSLQSGLMEANVAGMIGIVIVFYVLVIIAAIVATAQGFCNAICIYKIFESTVPEKSVKYLLLYLLVPMAGSICLLRCRNQGYEKVIVPETYPTYTEMPQQIISEEMVAEETISEETTSEETTLEE